MGGVVTARLLDVPLGWMNQHRGARAMGLLGEVVKMDVDGDGKASGPFLRARVVIDISKPLKRGALLKRIKDSTPEWFDAQFERLPYFCRLCGVLGHSDLLCATPAPRDADGRLPYDTKLRIEDKKKPQSFAEAAAESLGSATSSTTKQTKKAASKSEIRQEEILKGATSQETEGGITSPLKENVVDKEKGKAQPARAS